MNMRNRRMSLMDEVRRLAVKTRNAIERTVHNSRNMSEAEKDYLLSGACFVGDVANEDTLFAIRSALALTMRCDRALRKPWIGLAVKHAIRHGAAPRVPLRKAA